MDYFILAPTFLYLLFGALIAAFMLIEIRILRLAGSRTAVNRRYILVMLLLSWLGSYIDIPLVEIPSREYIEQHEFFFFGMKYVTPVIVNAPGTLIAVNVGGALIPTAVSIVLLLKKKLYLTSALGVMVISTIVLILASPVPGTGIAVPVFIPPLASAVTALLISRTHAAPLAYICGSLGTLIGGDLLNLGRIQSLSTSTASIGGAGMFDGIFITGLFAMVIASLATKGRSLLFK